MQPRFLLFLASTAIVLTATLLLDRSGLGAQLMLGLVVTALLVAFARTSSVPPLQVVCAVVLATTGEVVLSIGWGLYSYQHALIPLYVPPGHGVFYLLAAESAQQRLFKLHEHSIVKWVLIAGSVIAGVTLTLFGDVWGLIWWVAAATLLVRSRSRLLLASCFIYTILLEWLGTAIGNWRWASEVPWLGLRSANPPSGVGVLYILLDLLTVMTVAAIVRGRTATVLEPCPSAAAVTGGER